MSSLFKHHFLVAMPELNNSSFGQRYQDPLCYVCEHTANGAMGLVVNQPLDAPLGQLFTSMGIDNGRNRLDPIYRGGDTETQQGFVLHRATGRSWQASLPVSDSLSLTTSSDILEAIAHGKGPEEFMVVMGFMAWGPGQLEQELADNLWLPLPADESVLFDTVPELRSPAALKSLGIDFTLIPQRSTH